VNRDSGKKPHRQGRQSAKEKKSFTAKAAKDAKKFFIKNQGREDNAKGYTGNAAGLPISETGSYFRTVMPIPPLALLDLSSRVITSPGMALFRDLHPGWGRVFENNFPSRSWR